MSKGALGSVFPVSIVVLAIIAIWYLGAAYMNSQWTLDQAERAGKTVTTYEVLADPMNQKRPVLPAPHQVGEEIWKTTVEKKITSKRSLVYHGWITLSATLVGFALGTVLGIALAVAIVHSRVMELSAMPAL